MNRFEIWLCKRFLGVVISRRAGDLVPRSGDEGRKADCFHFLIDDNPDVPFRVDSLDGNAIKGKRWDGKSFSLNEEIPLARLLPAQLYITHYWGLSEVQYSGIYDFALNWVTKKPYVKLAILNCCEWVQQFLFNKRELQRVKRVRLLRRLVELHVRSGGKPTSHIWLMGDMYSMRFFLHPDREWHLKSLELQLQSFVSSGELSMTGGHFLVTGKAMGTIEEFEEDERRHSENVRIQWGILILSFATAFLALAQCNVIKLPTLIDFSEPASKRVGEQSGR